jgi:hypothetical protein
MAAGSPAGPMNRVTLKSMCGLLRVSCLLPCGPRRGEKLIAEFARNQKPELTEEIVAEFIGFSRGKLEAQRVDCAGF